MITINLAGFERTQKSVIKAEAERLFNGSLVIDPGHVAQHIELGQIAEISKFVLAICGFLMTASKVLTEHLEKEVWSPERFRETVEIECLKLGFENPKILKITNFEALKESKNEPCKVELSTQASQEHYVLYIMRDGSVYSLSASPPQGRSSS
ncbi:MAG: hypothetical protein ABIS50_09405 [Luteolibacter sp.]|uniref:hypothetical protein n=1 Tax=Luteolibacter sp. TaxID=1962973 RepID=UPI003265D0D0